MTKKIEKIQFITSPSTESITDQVEKACKGGITWVQLRIKHINKDELYTIAREVKEICDKYEAKLIINDQVDIAKEINASGVHLGKSDMNPADARVILGNDFIIGGTANTIIDIQKLVDCKVDYIGLGPFQFTTTKEGLSPVLGISGYKVILDKCKQNNIDTPIIAIGGIEQKHIKDILSTGVYGVAISGFIANAKNIPETSKQILNSVN